MPQPKRMHNRQNDDYKLLQRRQQVATMYVTGKGQWEIARSIGVSQGTVSNDLRAIRKEWLASALRDFDTCKSQELAKLDHLEATAWEAYERSCSPLKPGTLRRAGDPRFLERIQRCIELRLKVMGLVGPDVSQHLTVIDWNTLAQSIPAGPVEDTVEQQIIEAIDYTPPPVLSSPSDADDDPIEDELEREIEGDSE